MDISTSETEKLRSAYCPPLDEALFYAISSEYELPRDRDALSVILDSLKASALEQADTEFDPSGTGGLSHAQDATETSRSSPEDSVSNGVTSITTGFSDLRWKDSEDLGHDLDGSTLDQKTAWLLNIFPDIPKRELASILESHGGALDTATDELLNLSFLNHGYEEDSAEHVPVLKSIDAFVEGVQEPRKGRKKKKTRTTESSRASSASTPLSEREYIPSNVWSTMSKDVDFICSRASLHPQTVRSTYHEHGARLASTIQALTAKEGTDYSRVQVDPLVELQISEFQSQFQHVPKSQLYGVLILARKIPSAAYDLLEAMTAPGVHESLGQMHAQYAPVDLKENTPFESPTRTSGTNVMAGPGRASAAVYRAAATHSFDQASSAYKKSRSDRLYGGVAAHYAEIGRERAMAAKELKAAEADTLVARQSSSNVLDLHGVSVQDAVRIANSQTQSWWHSLGDAKYASGGGGPVRAGFRIVTGVGTHSKNHAPRIGPAVSKMLIREGWKIEIGHGELIVTGKSRR
ncbi:hypothetical protein LTR10_015335 [Elasticomyces elasticus]|uniref:Smr domain-containing protein n=1 Tax=Exophiala sideris TaxID=1016849 RepID=A0ABR0JJ54_9EURO|nr:hypothetical protein LTR10_015335 [Elasticomyces elasticus]KAK5030264.1 hypothetical protein LTR13_008283 [Exophiala sideris]KAK5035080.1 hypothetical protein LTS07_002515 [Exophiala sideris]KAK5066003.1 hypothetical protein LTR69_002520 [Exophiala sideris]KAK5178329.1 hypothetical protein LTR44_009205 [Eurotiomycetes sp. CCFEE 6388]